MLHDNDELLVEDDGIHIVVYGDLGHDCASFSNAGLRAFLVWCKLHRKKMCGEVF